MPGKEIKGRSKIATYRHGGRVKYATGTTKKLVGGQKKLDKDGDGKINYEEFMKAFTYIKPKGQI